MRLHFTVGVEVSPDELANLNEKRKRLGQQVHNAQEFVENKVLDALNVDKLLSGAICLRRGQINYVNEEDKLSEI